MAIFKCKMCGGTLEINNNETVAVCEYCGTKQTLPKLDDEKRVQLYDRANHFRRENEFDKAMGIYEMILSDDREDCESYWGLVLCRYGIEYVEDPRTHKRIPTVNRAQFTSIFDDEDYKNAIKFADGYQKDVYETEACVIDKIQKGILEISNKEEPFDVFICYKETDKLGHRTQDSVYAQDIYTALTKEGYKVFFSRITLEDKLGSAYEPYIFAALNSAKVMLVVGTEKDNFNAVWVKNEWSRFLSFIKAGKDKTLIPVYKDITPYDMPEEFQYLQSQDMGKIGFMQDLVRGISKIISSAEPKTEVKETVVVNNVNTNIAPLLKRAFMFLEDGDFVRADEFCEQVLNLDPECAEAYLGKLMADLKLKNQNDLGKLNDYFDENPNYQKAYRFADEKLKVAFKDYENSVELNIKEEIYSNAVNAYDKTNDCDVLLKTSKILKTISGYKDADALVEACLLKIENIKNDEIYNDARVTASSDKIESLEKAIELYRQIPNWKDSQEKILLCKQKINEIENEEEEARLERKRQLELNCIESKKRKKRNKRIAAIVTPIVAIAIAFVIVLNTVIIPSNKYNEAMGLKENGKYMEAIACFNEHNSFKDCDEQIKECYYLLAKENLEKENYGVAVINFSKAGDYKNAKELTKQIWDKVAIRDKISAGGSHSVVLKANNTVIASGYNDDGRCDVDTWTDIIAVSAADYHTVGLKSDGTVVATGSNDYGQCNVSAWTDIVAISAGTEHTVGLKSDGTVVATNWVKSYVGYYYGQCDVSTWCDIIAVSAGEYHTVGLKSDGTVVATKIIESGRSGFEEDYGQCDVENWKNVVGVSAGVTHTVGLKSDGTVVAVGDDEWGQCDVENWQNIVEISAGKTHTIGRTLDNTVVATEFIESQFIHNDGQCDVIDWIDIIAISAGRYHTIGLKSDGTVVAVGDNEDEQCLVGGKK